MDDCSIEGGLDTIARCLSAIEVELRQGAHDRFVGREVVSHLDDRAIVDGRPVLDVSAKRGESTLRPSGRRTALPAEQVFAFPETDRGNLDENGNAPCRERGGEYWEW